MENSHSLLTQTRIQFGYFNSLVMGLLVGVEVEDVQ